MTEEAPKKSKRLPGWGLWFVALILVVLVGGVFLIRGQRLSSLDRDIFELAKSHWNDNRLTDYEVEVTVTGRQPGIYVVKVQNGIAVESSMDGRALTRPRTFGTWSVDGMFETLQRDLDTNEIDNNLMLGAVFDETFGYPLRYERLEMKTGVHDSLQWEVTRFVIPSPTQSPGDPQAEQQASQP